LRSYLLTEGESSVRRIQVEEGLTLRFPGRDDSFDEGVEIGILAVLLSFGGRGFTHVLSQRTLEQAREMAQNMGYRLTEGPHRGELVEVILRSSRDRPKLRLVDSQVDARERSTA
jgi:hypothetical protein